VTIPGAADAVATLAQAQGVRQVALVVRDLDASIRAWWDLLRIGPWNAYTLSPDILQDMRYHGRPARFGLRHAFGWRDTLQIELVQPLEGPSIFADHLQRHGEGLHHIGVYVPDHARAVAEFRGQGFEPLQSARGFGVEGDGAFAYFRTDHPLAAIVELIEAPRIRRPAEMTYPEKP
jgi:catechol 2,3-dioxygenase-like lactoylglutathione lyase family enzyme